jgi:phosphoribosylanthranilate isomerase
MLEGNLIQIAGVIDAAEAQMLQQRGVRYLGFPLRLPVHREDLTEEEAAAIIKSLAPLVFGVLITGGGAMVTDLPKSTKSFATHG